MKVFVYPLLSILLLCGALMSSDTRAAQPPGAEEAPEQPKRSEEPLETFVPSEKLPADSAISFPVDI